MKKDKRNKPGKKGQPKKIERVIKKYGVQQGRQGNGTVPGEAG